MFLAVSGALLASVMSLIAGQQANTEFTTNMRTLESQMQDVLNDVATGTSEIGEGCTAPASPDGVPVGSGAAQEQGTSSGCVYVGKALQFAPAGQPGAYTVSTIVGRRESNPGKEVQNLAEAKPTILGQRTTETLGSGLEFKYMKVNDTANRYGFALVSSFGQTSVGPGAVVSGSANTGMLQMRGIVKGSSTDDGVTAVNQLSLATPLSTVLICVGDPEANGRLGAVKINGRGTELLFDSEAQTAGCRD